MVGSDDCGHLGNTRWTLQYKFSASFDAHGQTGNLDSGNAKLTVLLMGELTPD